VGGSSSANVGKDVDMEKERKEVEPFYGYQYATRMIKIVVEGRVIK
jgi:hypothetical protein